MRPRLFDKLGRALAACLFASLAASAQEAKPSIEQKAAPAQRLVVQVESHKGARPTFQSVPGAVWHGSFATVPTPQPRAAADTVQAVDVKTLVGEGGRVEIRVGVHLGERLFDRFEAVATYHAAPGETVTANELERVGVAPFVFKVLSVGDTDTAAPSVQNATQSIEAVVSEFTPSPLPRGKLTLRNLSPKRVRAVYVIQVVNGRNRLQGFLAEPEGKTLMQPGGSAEKAFGVTTGEPSAAGFLPTAVETLVVAAVLFEDYTYEGELEYAATKRALLEGERAQLPRLLALLREAQAAPPDPGAARALREKALALSDEVPRPVLDAMLKDYAGAKPADPANWQSAIEVAMHELRRELIDDLERFEKESRAKPPAVGFKDWLRQRQARYEVWLSRL
ncbi:MAG TPA: hypothetical protein VF588_23035 [Pyrinomonadaceae bacterium]|jgi:hypothetical protein